MSYIKLINPINGVVVDPCGCAIAHLPKNSSRRKITGMLLMGDIVHIQGHFGNQETFIKSWIFGSEIMGWVHTSSIQPVFNSRSSTQFVHRTAEIPVGISYLCDSDSVEKIEIPIVARVSNLTISILAQKIQEKFAAKWAATILSELKLTVPNNMAIGETKEYPSTAIK